MSLVTIMFVSDVCGQPGRQAASYLIKELREQHSVDYVICNVENAAGGFGITPEMSSKMFSYGIDMQTSGNHIWDRHEVIKYLHERPKLLRPANFPNSAPGTGSYVDSTEKGKIATLNLMGRVYMKDIDCPFQVADRIVNRLREESKVIIVDMHAEATSEKQAMLHHLDGRVSAILGTHTHVQTADDHISKRGTAYITDVGMTGPHDSIIGMQKDPSLARFLTGMPKRFSTATDDIRLSAAIMRIDATDGSCQEFTRLQETFDLEEWTRKAAERKLEAPDSI
jgi:metallophosphoesterase (TIGR00282 family)